MKRLSVSAVILAIGAMAIAFAQEHKMPVTGEAGKPDHIMVTGTELKWMPGPAALPSGAQMAVLEGDPAQPGLFTMRIKVPANYRIPPHWHPADEHVTVISGSFLMGLGEKFDEKGMTELPPGGFAVMAVGTRHFAMTKKETVVQVHAMGPWGINYVNPADDPRQAKSTKP